MFANCADGEGVITNLVEGYDIGCGDLKKAIPTDMQPINKAILHGIALLQR